MASRGMERKASDLIGLLNGISVGEIDAIRGKLESAQQELLSLEQPELAQAMGEALSAVAQGDVKNFRRLVAQVVSKLGHVRD